MHIYLSFYLPKTPIPIVTKERYKEI